MKSRIKKYLLTVLIFLTFFVGIASIMPKPVAHADCNDAMDYLLVRLFNTTNIRWEVRFDIYDPNIHGWTGWLYDYVGASANGAFITKDHQFDVLIAPGLTGGTCNGLKYEWATTCVDPAGSLAATSTSEVYNGFVNYYYKIDVSCYSIGQAECTKSGYLGSTYAACSHLDAHGQTVNLTDECPQQGNPIYCAYNGDIYGGTGATPSVPNTCAVACDVNTQTCNGCHTASVHYCSTSYCYVHTVTNNSCTDSCPVPGVCGSSNGQNFYTAPSANLCSTGSSSSVGGSGPWSWTCGGQNGGGTPTCTANKSVDGVCGTNHWNCSAGSDTANVDNGGNYYTWTCSGINNGSSPSCSEKGMPNVPVPSVSGSPACSNSPFPATVNWTNTSGNGGYYALRIDDQTANDWNGLCDGSQNSGDICQNVSGTSFNFTFTPYHTYSIWVHAINGAGVWSSGPGSTSLGPIPYCPYNANVNVYVDYNGNGSQDINGQGIPTFNGTTEPAWTGTNDISYWGALGGADANHATNRTTPYTISNIPPGTNNETIRVNLPDATWKATTTTPVTEGGPPDTTVNFGIQPPPPICTLTVTSPIYVGGQSTLTANCRVGGGTGTLNYTWSSIVIDPSSPSTPASLGNVNNPNVTQALNTNTYSAPTAGSTFKQFIVDAAVTACNPGTNPGMAAANPALCTSKTIAITVNPLFSVKGVVFTDTNKDLAEDNGESNYNGITVNVCPGQYCATAVPQVNGAFDTGYVLTAGSYNVTASGQPAGYFFTTPPTLSPTVGNPCSPSSGACDANYNVYNLHFGISNSRTWIQSTGGDIYESGGVNNPMPIPGTVPAACGGTSANMSITQGQIQEPGIIFTGNGANDFGQGYPSANLNNHWLVSQAINLLSTSYTAVMQNVQDSGITPAAWSCNLSACVLPTAPGVYTIGQATDTVKITSNTTFPNSNPNIDKFTFFIPGKLEIGASITVQIGAVATFIVKGDINVDGNVGEAVNTSSTSDIDGYYSTDGSFFINGTNDCTGGPSSADKRLNVSGAIVVNAAGASVGTLQVKRDMCAGDVCPTFSITTRPDFVLYAPTYLETGAALWKEIAP
jgi:hypothetical protein